jgi:hypothetical protein
MGGATRVKLSWPNWNGTNPAGTLQHRLWMELTVKASPTTGLAADDKYYIGFLPGEITGVAAGSYRVQSQDYNGIFDRRAPASACGTCTGTNSQLIDSLWDLDHSRTVNSADYQLSFDERQIAVATDRLVNLTVP